MASTALPPIEDPARIPVIVGVGQVNDRPADPQLGLDSLGLMEVALRLADADAGGGWLAKIDSLAVVDQISFPRLGDVSGSLAARLGAAPRILHQTPYASGDSPVLLLNEAANRIGSGEITVAAIVGGEALRTAAQRAAAAAGGDPSAQNAMRDLTTRRTPGWRQRYGLVAPVDVYPLYENACRAAYGQSLAEAQAETGQIWSRFSEIAAHEPGAWMREALSVEEITRPSAANRPIAFPYLKRMVANISVNQGAGFLVTSLKHARDRGVPDDRLIYVGHGAAAQEPGDILMRDAYDRSPSMSVSLTRTLELNGLTTDDLDFVELYSCFPCVPKMARRVIGWPLEKPATVFGGLTFGGGPIGNYMSHAVTCMVQALRRRGRFGLLFANGGYATHNHALVLSSAPIPGVAFPMSFDVQPEADAARGPSPILVESYVGRGTIETYTVFYNRDGSAGSGLIVVRTPHGERTLAKVPANDPAGIASLVAEDANPIGSDGLVQADDDGDQIWITSEGASPP